MSKISRKALYAEVARHTDTLGTKINAAETSRVIASYFRVLACQQRSGIKKAHFLLEELDRAETARVMELLEEIKTKPTKKRGE